MYALILTKEQLEYVGTIFVGYVRNGLNVTELALATSTHLALQNAREIARPDHLGKARITDLEPGKVAIELDPEPFAQ
jgi:hypothetical protein